MMRYRYMYLEGERFVSSFYKAYVFSGFRIVMRDASCYSCFAVNIFIYQFTNLMKQSRYIAQISPDVSRKLSKLEAFKGMAF